MYLSKSIHVKIKKKGKEKKMRNPHGSSTPLLLLVSLSVFATASPLRLGHVRRDHYTVPERLAKAQPPLRKPPIIRGLGDSAAIILFVALGCATLLVLMFVYIWLKRRRSQRIPRKGRRGKDTEEKGREDEKEGERDTWMCEITRPERVLTLRRDATADGGFGLHVRQDP